MDQREENERPDSAASAEAHPSPEAPRLGKRRPRPLFIWTGAGAIGLAITLVSATLLLNHPTSARPMIPQAPLSIYLSSSDLRAFDARDGHMRWRYESKDAAGAPLLVDNVLYLGAFDGKVTAIKAADGSILWTYQIEGAQGDALVDQVTDGVVYVGYQARGTTLQQIYALDALTGALLWRFDDGAFVSGVVNGIVYVYSYPDEIQTPDANVYALNASDGSVRWQFQAPTRWKHILRVADGQVYIFGYPTPDGSVNGTLSVLNASDGSLRWSYAPADLEAMGDVEVEHGLAYVVWAEGGILFGKSGAIFLTALDEANGATRWQQTLGQASNALVPFFVDNGVIYTMEGFDGLTAYNEADGRLLWQALQGQVRIFATADGVIYLSVTTYSANAPSVVMALNASDGSIRWQSARYAISGTLNSGVLYCVLYPYAGPDDYNPNLHSLLFALNASDGLLRWSEETIQLSWSPAVG